MNASPSMSAREGLLVTIAIPTFNRVGWLKKCLSSALSQTYRCLEVLVSDNASTDGTEKYLASISDPRVRVIRQAANIGLLGNWNACLSAATGEYIVFLPDDDSIAPHFLDRCVSLIRLQPRIPALIALTNSCQILANGSSIIHPATKSKILDTGIWEGTDILLEYLRRHIFVQACTVLMRTEYLRMMGGFRADLPYAADLAAWGPLLMMNKCGFVNEDCGSFTHHLDSQTERNSFETKLWDHTKVVKSLVTVARERVSLDSAKRTEFIKEAFANINQNITEKLIRKRREGASSAYTAAILLGYRREAFVRGLTPRNFRRLVHLMILILLPLRLHSSVRWLKARIYRSSQDSRERAKPGSFKALSEGTKIVRTSADR